MSYGASQRELSRRTATQYLLADPIGRAENTGFSYASPGHSDPALIGSHALPGAAPSEDGDETLVQQPAYQIPGGTSLRSDSQLEEI
jgi:hypothetical protein